MRFIVTILLWATSALLANAESADLSQVWRGGLASARDLCAHAQMAPVLERLHGDRRAAFAAATAKPDLLVRHAGQIVVGTACAADCGAAGAFVVADTRRGEALVILAAPGKRGAERFERFATPGFPTPTESVQAALARWRAKYR